MMESLLWMIENDKKGVFERTFYIFILAIGIAMCPLNEVANR